MKNYIAVGLMALFVLASCVGGILYVDHATDQMQLGLETCVDHAEKDDMEKAKEQLEKVASLWEKQRNILMMYTDQEILDDVDDQLDYLEALADHHKEEFVPAAVLCMGKLREMRQREDVSLYSWF